ncbi:MAG: isochorismatase family protein [Elusimicrobia bacterium]|nr:isochorismatase family protein [Elusimicrobiota bacterium]
MDVFDPQKLGLGPGDAFLAVDVQNDHLPGGTLVVPRGNEVVPALNRYIDIFVSFHLPLLATRKWHPRRHCLFIDQGGPWPPHCLQNSSGAEFCAQLKLPPWTVVILKGMNPSVESGSGFAGTALHDRLQALGISRLFIGGLALETGILETVRDALAAGYIVYMLLDAVRPMNPLPAVELSASEEMLSLGAVPLQMEEAVVSPAISF